jgi:hypothetical protein
VIAHAKALRTKKAGAFGDMSEAKLLEWNELEVEWY